MSDDYNAVEHAQTIREHYAELLASDLCNVAMLALDDAYLRFCEQFPKRKLTITFPMGIVSIEMDSLRLQSSRQSRTVFVELNTDEREWLCTYHYKTLNVEWLRQLVSDLCDITGNFEDCCPDKVTWIGPLHPEFIDA